MKRKRNYPGSQTQTLQMQRWMWLLAATVILVSCATSSLQTPVPSSAAPLESAPASTPSPPSPAISPSIVATEIEHSPEQLWSLLQQAEDSVYAVLIQHATAPGTGDPPNFQEDCSTQRNLSQAGRQQAIQMGEAFRSRNIPVIRVVSSQWCRCLETAELMNLGEVKPLPPLNSFFGDRSTGDEQNKQAQQFLLRNQAIAGVIVMVTHQVNITALSDVVPQSGEAVVIQIGEEGQLTVLGRIPASQS